MNDRSTVRLLIFPHDDAALGHEVGTAFADVSPDLPEPRQMAELQRRLRRFYGSLVVRGRDELGGYEDDPARVWYIFRDGRIHPYNEPLERLYTVLAAVREKRRSSERPPADVGDAANPKRSNRRAHRRT